MSITDTTLATAPKREFRVVEDHGPLANLFDSARFEHLIRVANLMASASLIPDHMWMDMKTKAPLAAEFVKGNCFLVVNQAVRWGMDPFAVVPETYVVGGKLGFQGKLVCAVINSRAPIKSNLDFEFSGKIGTDDFRIRVFATLKTEDKPREITLTVGQGKTDNKMWTKDPEQKLVYSGATKWARRHCPEIILGVLTEDDLEMIAMQEKNITSAPRAKVPKEDKALPAPETTSPTAASGGDESPKPATMAESAKPETGTAQTLEQQLQALLDADKVTDSEFEGVLRFFEVSIPKKFEGVKSMTDATAKAAIDGWETLRLEVIARREKKEKK